MNFNNYNPYYDDINCYVGNQNIIYGYNPMIDYINENINHLFQNNKIEEKSYFDSEEIDDEIGVFSQRRTLETLPNYFIDKKKNLHKKNVLVSPRLYHFDKIEYIIKESVYENKFSDKVKKIKINSYIEKEEKKMEEEELKEKNKKEEQINDFDYNNLFIFIQNDYVEKKKRGREPENNEYVVGSHNKMSPDNIIKKIKAQIFIYPLNFLNNISNKANSEKENKINKLDYQIVNKMKKDLELKFLDTPLKDLFSMRISPKLTKKSKLNNESNKNIINNILNKEADDTIMFAFNMTFRDWFDLFTYKKNVKEIMDSYDLSNYNKIDSERIEKCMVGVDDFLNKMVLNNNDEVYFSIFVFYLYNYERWFYIKKGRNRKSSKNK